jgi:hypothetical protein
MDQTPIFNSDSLILDKVVKLPNSHDRYSLTKFKGECKIFFMPKINRPHKLGKVVKYLLDKKGITPAELARRMGISAPMVSDIINNVPHKGGLTDGSMEALFEALEVTPLEFFGLAAYLTDYGTKALQQPAEANKKTS